jgi:hypothetical protein
MLWHLWRGIGKQPMQITMMMTAMLIVMQTLDKESEVKVGTAVFLLRFNCAEKTVGPSAKAAYQLCAASKSILTWKIAHRAMGKVPAQLDTSVRREHSTYLQEE